MRGFTLLEVLVVIVIVAVIVSLAVISIGDNAARRLDEEARRVRALLRLAADEAVLQGREIGVVVNDDGYSFLVYDDRLRQWARLDSDRIFRTRKLPEGIRLQLFLDDQALVLPTAGEDDAGEAGEAVVTRPPQLLLLSSGEITPFELEIRLDEARAAVVLRGTANGTIEEVIDGR